MLFPTEEFLLIFLPVVLAVYYGIHFITHNITAKNVWLLIASIIFYAWGEPVYVFLMIGSILFNYLMALAIQAQSDRGNAVNKRVMLVLTIAVNIVVLFWFKYAGAVLRTTPWAELTENIVLPIGISFYTFQAMSYVIDVYRGDVYAERNPLYVGLYVSFFPQLIAGPIVRYKSIDKKIKSRSESPTGFAAGAERFVRGLIKKVLIANRMAVVADAVWNLIIADKLQASVSLAWLGAISYTLQIFFDFSGYSDMAIGLGGMFGFELPENFDHPYMAKSVTEFWRRWHMTLSRWFRDYVYIPLGGSRKGSARLIFNLFIVWLLTGIWHGDCLTFVLWGMIYFVILTIEKFCKVKVTDDDKKRGNLLTNTVRRLYTLLTVILAWVIFRSDSLADAMAYIRGMFPVASIISGISTVSAHGAALAYLRQNLVYYIAAVVLCFPVREKLKSRAESLGVSIYHIFYGLIMAGGLILALSYIYNNAYSPFIYFNF